MCDYPKVQFKLYLISYTFNRDVSLYFSFSLSFEYALPINTARVASLYQILPIVSLDRILLEMFI